MLMRRSRVAIKSPAVRAPFGPSTGLATRRRLTQRRRGSSWPETEGNVFQSNIISAAEAFVRRMADLNQLLQKQRLK